MKTAPEIIAEYFSTDWNDVKDGRYQRYANPSVYVYGSKYFCCPTSKQKPSKDFEWESVYKDEKTGRTVYRAIDN